MSGVAEQLSSSSRVDHVHEEDVLNEVMSLSDSDFPKGWPSFTIPQQEEFQDWLSILPGKQRYFRPDDSENETLQLMRRLAWRFNSRFEHSTASCSDVSRGSDG